MLCCTFLLFGTGIEMHRQAVVGHRRQDGLYVFRQYIFMAVDQGIGFGGVEQRQPAAR